MPLFSCFRSSLILTHSLHDVLAHSHAAVEKGSEVGAHILSGNVFEVSARKLLMKL